MRFIPLGDRRGETSSNGDSWGAGGPGVRIGRSFLVGQPGGGEGGCAV